MSSGAFHYITVILAILTHNKLCPVKGQSTIQGSQKEDLSNRIITEIEELIRNQEDVIITNLQYVERRSQEQVQHIYQLLNTSFQQLKNQLDTVMLNYQSVDRRLQEQDTYMKKIASNHEILTASHEEIMNLNESLQQIKHRQDVAMISLRAVEQRSQEQSICSSQVQTISEFVNTSFQQTQNQQVSVMTSLVAIDRRLNEHDIFVRNKTEIILEQTNAGTGEWIVIMHRFDGSVNFNRNWTEYRNGFGDKIGGEFWLGNEEVHRLTNRAMYTLRIEVQLKASGVWYYAEYSTFSLESEDNKYTLRLSGYSGNAGDSLTNTSLNADWYHGGMMFSTSDNDNDRNSDGNCGRSYECGWWFNKCYISCLTCNYLNKFKWCYNSGWPSSGLLRAARMMIKSK